MIKRLQITLLALFVSVWAMASETSVKNADGVEIWYDFDSSAKTASVTRSGGADDSGNVVIPSKVTYEGEKYSVTSIGSFAFNYCSSLTSITIPEGVTSIGEWAFSNCSSLTSITIPESVKTIDSYAFCYCSSLTSITLSESVTEIGSYTFAACSSLTSITIPESVTLITGSTFNGCSSLTSIDVASDNNSYTSIDGVLFSKDKTTLIQFPGGKKDVTSYAIPESVTKIGNSAFNQCNSLTSITIPKGVTEIGVWAFSYCSSLTSITLPESVTEIGDDAFNGCSSLTSIDVVSDNNSYISIDGVLFSKDQTILIKYPEGKKDVTSYVIPEGVTKIGEYAFHDCRSLTSVTIPESVTEIGDDAFSGCSGLTSVTIPESVTSIGQSAFSYCSGLTSVEFNAKNCTSMGSYNYPVFLGCTKLTNLTIGESVTNIPSCAFEGCSSLTSITLPESVTEIGASAFKDCSGLTSVAIPESVTEIGVYAFHDCRSLTSVTIPESVTEIGDDAFSGCSGLTSVTIPESVTSIGPFAFESCSGLTSVEFNAKNCTSMESYYGPVFSGCTKLTNLTIGENVTNIPSYAFDGCSSLTSIDVALDNNSYTSIDGVLFNKDKTILIKYPEGKKDVTSYIIPEGVTEIGERAFEFCSSLTSITIPEGVTSIGYAAFEACRSLTSITIPESVTEIGVSAFNWCESLISITSMNVTPPSIGIGIYPTFNGVDKSIPVYVLKQSVEAYKSAEYWKDFTNIVGKFLVVTATAENGTVTGAGVYEENEEVTLIATPDEGYTFVKWSDGETNATRKITVTEDVTLTAVFESNSSDSPISDVVADSVSIRLIGNSLIVEGAESYAVYALSGQYLGKVESLERGLYIVVADGVSKKIVVK